MKKLWKQVAAAVMSGAMMLSFAGAVKADDYYINDLGEEGFQERVEEVQNEDRSMTLPAAHGIAVQLNTARPACC